MIEIIIITSIIILLIIYLLYVLLTGKVNHEKIYNYLEKFISFIFFLFKKFIIILIAYLLIVFIDAPNILNIPFKNLTIEMIGKNILNIIIIIFAASLVFGKENIKI